MNEKELQKLVRNALVARAKLASDVVSDSYKEDIKSDQQHVLSYYAWPGGYPIVYYTKDGGWLCPKCVNDNLELTDDITDPQWYLVACEIYYEGPPVLCDNCNEEIESAYGDPEEEDNDEDNDEENSEEGESDE